MAAPRPYLYLALVVYSWAFLITLIGIANELAGKTEVFAELAVIRHHGAFLTVMGTWTFLWIMQRQLVHSWMIESRASRIWMISAGFTNCNEAFIVLQNFLPNRDSKEIAIIQPCIALGVMVQAVVFGFPAGLHLFLYRVWPQLLQEATLPLILFSIGIATQLIAQPKVQIVDSWKVYKKIRRKLAGQE